MACVQPGGMCFCRNSKGKNHCCTNFWLCVLTPIAKCVIYVFVIMAIIMMVGTFSLLAVSSGDLIPHYGEKFVDDKVGTNDFIAQWITTQLIAAVQQVFVGYITFTLKWKKANDPTRIKKDKKREKFIKKLNKGMPYPGYPTEQYLKGKKAKIAPAPQGQGTMTAVPSVGGGQRGTVAVVTQ